MPSLMLILTYIYTYFGYYTNDFNHASLVSPLLTFWDSLDWQIPPLIHKVAKYCISGDCWRYLQCIALRPFPTKGTFLTFISFSNTFPILYANLIMRGLIYTFWFSTCSASSMPEPVLYYA